jgi:hypothetical protein
MILDAESETMTTCGLDGSTWDVTKDFRVHESCPQTSTGITGCKREYYGAVATAQTRRVNKVLEMKPQSWFEDGWIKKDLGSCIPLSSICRAIRLGCDQIL